MVPRVEVRAAHEPAGEEDEGPGEARARHSGGARARFRLSNRSDTAWQSVQRTDAVCARTSATARPSATTPHNKPFFAGMARSIPPAVGLSIRGGPGLQSGLAPAIPVLAPC